MTQRVRFVQLVPVTTTNAPTPAVLGLTAGYSITVLYALDSEGCAWWLSYDTTTGAPRWLPIQQPETGA